MFRFIRFARRFIIYTPPSPEGAQAKFSCLFAQPFNVLSRGTCCLSTARIKRHVSHEKFSPLPLSHPYFAFPSCYEKTSTEFIFHRVLPVLHPDQLKSRHAPFTPTSRLALLGTAWDDTTEECVPNSATSDETCYGVVEPRIVVTPVIRLTSRRFLKAHRGRKERKHAGLTFCIHKSRAFGAAARC